jgi:hypothetical protein
VIPDSIAGQGRVDDLQEKIAEGMKQADENADARWRHI